MSKLLDAGPMTLGTELRDPGPGHGETCASTAGLPCPNLHRCGRCRAVDFMDPHHHDHEQVRQAPYRPTN